jgi:hypothetical protein
LQTIIPIHIPFPAQARRVPSLTGFSPVPRRCRGSALVAGISIIAAREHITWIIPPVIIVLIADMVVYPDVNCNFITAFPGLIEGVIGRPSTGIIPRLGRSFSERPYFCR